MILKQTRQPPAQHAPAKKSIGESPYLRANELGKIPANPRKIRAAIYARTSTRGQDPDNQLPTLRAFCQAHEWPVITEYIDQASGSNGDRPQFQALMTAAGRREFDVVVFWSLDRFTREGVRKTLDYLGQLHAYGVGFRSYTQQFFDTCGPFRDAVISIMATLAELERKQICDRVQAGMARARRAGRTLGRPRQVVNMQQLADMARRKSYADIAAETGMSKATISRRITEYNRSNP